MQPYMTLKALDYSGELSSVKFHTPDITDANFAQYTSTMLALKAALEDLSLATWGDAEFVSEIHTDTAALPSDPYAQRERRAIFNCIDSVTGRRFKIGVPCADLTDMAIQGTDAINMANAEVAAYVLAVETYALSPEGNAFVVLGGVVTGVSS